jgi:hypothetical protein
VSEETVQAVKEDLITRISFKEWKKKWNQSIGGYMPLLPDPFTLHLK